MKEKLTEELASLEGIDLSVASSLVDMLADSSRDIHIAYLISLDIKEMVGILVLIIAMLRLKMEVNQDFLSSCDNVANILVKNFLNDLLRRL